MLMPSHYARTRPQLDDLARELGVDRARRPRSADAACSDVADGIHGAFDYVKKSTAVNSPIEASLGSRQGVCQDFAHIMIAVVRGLGIPVPLRQRLSLSRRRAPRPLGGRRHPRLGRSAAARPGLGRVRSDQRPDRRQPAHPHRGRPRLRRRAADPRHDEGPRRDRAAGPRPRRRRRRRCCRRTRSSPPTRSGRCFSSRTSRRCLYQQEQ